MILHPIRGAGLASVLALLCLGAGCKQQQGGSPAGDAGGAASGEVATLSFSAIPDQNQTELKEKFDALAAHLAGVLEVPVRYVPARDYQASVEMFKNGDVQLAWFGGLTGVQAMEAVPGARAIAQGDTDPEFKSYFIVNASTGLEASDTFPKELADLTFTFGSESSTSGRLMPAYYIQQETGMAPEQFFKNRPGFSGSHDKTVELVESGAVQAGVVNFETYDQRVAQGKTDPAKVKVVWTTPTYPDYNFTAHPDLERTFGAGFTDMLQAALVAVDDPALLSAFPRKALIPAKNEDYEMIRTVAKELGFLR
jgi:phosphonate transport system substrate-binding protein